MHVVVRAVEQVTRGGGPADQAEALLLEEAGRRDPRDLLGWGLGLLRQLAPEEARRTTSGRGHWGAGRR